MTKNYQWRKVRGREKYDWGGNGRDAEIRKRRKRDEQKRSKLEEEIEERMEYSTEGDVGGKRRVRLYR